jgi:lysine 2,3-aminomutase
MSERDDSPTFDRGSFLAEARRLLEAVAAATSLEEARGRLAGQVLDLRIANSMTRSERWTYRVNRVRDCARVLLILFSARSDSRTGFSAARALWDLARGEERSDLGPGFYAEMIHLVRGLEGRTADTSVGDSRAGFDDLDGREAALARSDDLDNMWERVEGMMGRYEHGLAEAAIERRERRRREILERLGATDEDWTDWRWQVAHVAVTAQSVARLVGLAEEETRNIERARESRIPFGVTPFYLGLMDDRGGERDRAVRAQVFPPARYVDVIGPVRGTRDEELDFMQERNTSPVDLVTRRYPNIAILKPYNTCPQICVYCQRNWEIDEVLAPGAMADWSGIEAAVRWIGDHRAIHEVLITGGDPLLMEDRDLVRLLDLVCALPSINRVRIGTRTPVTLPMRITGALADLLGSYRLPGRREIAVVTHVQHPYELNPDLVAAVERLKRRGIPVYNQLVYTFFVSRRFEAALLRRLLRQAGVEPYYTFLPKGKEETDDYRVPLSRLLQEQAEEARLLPGLARTDEAVYNVPRLGKNNLRAGQHRDLLAILPDGTRMYEFHPWEKNIVPQKSYIGAVVPILGYLERLEAIGEDPAEYESIWYYF